MDSDNEMFITQNNPSINSNDDRSDSDSEAILSEIAGEIVSASEKRPNNYAPYGLPFSDISEDEGELLITATQDAENKYKQRFGQPVSEAEVMSKSRKRQVFCYVFIIKIVVGKIR